MKEQQQDSPEEHPEFDAVGIWRSIIEAHQTEFTRSLPAEKLEQMPLFLAEMYRGISRRRLRLYPHVREVLDVLRERYPLAIVTDAQSAYARAELHKVGLLDYFDPIVVSGDHGYRKPDRRLFQLALDRMGVAAEHALYVGNDMHRDIFGAQEAGMTTVKFESDQGRRRLPGLRARLHDHRSPRPPDDPRRWLTRPPVIRGFALCLPLTEREPLYLRGSRVGEHDRTRFGERQRELKLACG